MLLRKEALLGSADDVRVWIAQLATSCYARESRGVIHRASSCRVDGESVKGVVNVQNMRSGDGNGG